MEFVKLSWRTVLPIYWAFCWRWWLTFWVMTNTFSGPEREFPIFAGVLTNRITFGTASVIGMCCVIYFVPRLSG